MKYIKIPQVAFKFQQAVVITEKIQRSSDAEEAFRQLWQDDIAGVESFYVLALNTANQGINIMKHSMGGVSATYVDPRTIALHLVKSRASFAIIAHNHPSGNLTPSEQDIKITNKLREGLKMLDIQLIAHLILSPTEGQYYSFADNGEM